MFRTILREREREREREGGGREGGGDDYQSTIVKVGSSHMHVYIFLPVSEQKTFLRYGVPVYIFHYQYVTTIDLVQSLIHKPLSRMKIDFLHFMVGSLKHKD